MELAEECRSIYSTKKVTRNGRRTIEAYERKRRNRRRSDRSSSEAAKIKGEDGWRRGDFINFAAFPARFYRLLTDIDEFDSFGNDKLDAELDVFHLLRSNARIFVVATETLLREDFEENDQVDAVAEIDFEIAYGARVFLQVLVHPSGERFLLNSLPFGVLRRLVFHHARHFDRELSNWRVATTRTRKLSQHRIGGESSLRY